MLALALTGATPNQINRGIAYLGETAHPAIEPFLEALEPENVLLTRALIYAKNIVSKYPFWGNYTSQPFSQLETEK